MFYKKEPLKNMSQGARLEFIMEFKHMKNTDIAISKLIREWEGNSKSPDAKNLPRLAEVYEVSMDAIKNYDFIDLIDEIYYQMWLEKQYPYYEFKLPDRIGGSPYNLSVQKGINEWLRMIK